MKKIPVAHASASTSEKGRHYNKSLPGPPAQSKRRRSQTHRRHVTTGTATAHAIDRREARQRRSNRVRILIALCIVTVLGVGAAIFIVFGLPLLQGPCEFTNAPSEYEILLCERASEGIDCSFDVSQCSSGCILGYQQDQFACPVSCDCATKGSFENDVSFNPNNIQSVLSAYIKEEDSAFDLMSGSVSIQQNLWNLNIVNGRARVPYVLAKDAFTNEKALNAIRLAFHAYSMETCIDFRPRKNESDFLEFTSRSKGCRSFIGRIGGRQTVSIGKGCERVGVVQHELMHALGFWHEQSRPDRDDYVKIQRENIAKEYQHNFKARGRDSVRSFGSSYDKGSIMHYDGYSFSMNGQPTIVNKLNDQPVVAQRNNFSIDDVFEINKLYLCVLNTSITDPQPGDHWDVWLPWQPCSASCDQGQKVRSRECKDASDVIVYSGRCSGLFYESQKCESRPCEEGKWGEWSSCSVSCGSGTRIRESCCHPNVKYERQSCTTEKCTGLVLASWSLWESWGFCSRTCGTGWQRRTRECLDLLNNVVSIRECPWMLPGATELSSCSTEHCNETDEIVGEWDEWGTWSQCSESCGAGVQFRYRDCLGNIPGEGGCSGDEDDMQVCKANKDCVTEEGSVANWGPWSGWSLCSVTCNVGSRERERVCYGLKYEITDKCRGPQMGKTKEKLWETCKMKSCSSTSSLPAAGRSTIGDSVVRWSEWSMWGVCSKSCDTGVRWRKRKCMDGRIGGTGCEDSPLEAQQCQSNPCSAVDSASPDIVHEILSHWSEWLPWSKCTRTCDIGVRMRKRVCVNGVTGDRGCEHMSHTDTRKLLDTTQEYCNKDPCDSSQYQWTTWTLWTSCSQSCHGIRSRKRQYECVPPMLCGILPDITVDNITEECNKVCGWTEWGSWMLCSTSCGKGTRSRSRICSPGFTCEGKNYHTIPCNIPCRSGIRGRVGSPNLWNQSTIFCDKYFQIVDYDNDGLYDMLCISNGTLANEPNSISNHLVIAINNGDGTFRLHEVDFTNRPLMVECNPVVVAVVGDQFNFDYNSRFDSAIRYTADVNYPFRDDMSDTLQVRLRRKFVHRRSNKGLCGVKHGDTSRNAHYLGKVNYQMFARIYGATQVFCYNADGQLTKVFFNLVLDDYWYANIETGDVSLRHYYDELFFRGGAQAANNPDREFFEQDKKRREHHGLRRRKYFCDKCAGLTPY